LKSLLAEYENYNEMDFLYFFEKYFQYYLKTDNDLDVLKDISMELINN
jgi:hypothetical protein